MTLLSIVLKSIIRICFWITLYLTMTALGALLADVGGVGLNEYHITHVKPDLMIYELNP